MEMDKWFNAFRKGQMDRKDLETLIFSRIRENVLHFRPEKMNRENCEDFVSWLYPRIKNSIDRYKDQGSSFDAYINVLVKLSAKEYCLREKSHLIIEKTWWDVKAEEMLECNEDEPDYFEPKKDFSLVKNPKQVLLLILKSYHYLSDDYIRRAAPAIGMDGETLKDMVDTMRNQRLGQEEQSRRLQERIHSQFYRCLTFEYRMRTLPAGSPSHRNMEKKLDRAKKRLEAMRKHFAAMRLEAPNWQIANIVGSKKGTIDSNLYNARRNYERNHTAQK
ncbi:MAG: hypothetical protein LBI67_09380 [Treponema sp.]|nr:hypothetical protein [Treponema sp.]